MPECMKRIGLLSLLLMSVVVVRAHVNNEEMTASVRLLSIGEAFIQAGNYDKATQIYEDAVEAARGVEEKWVATDKLATLYSVAGRDKDALKCYEVLLSDSSVINNAKYQMYIYGGMGTVYMRRADYIRAIKSFDRAVEISHIQRDEKFLSLLYSNMSRTLLIAGDVKRAEALIDSAENLGKKNNDNHALVNVYNVQAEMYCKYGDYENAYLNLQKYVEHFNKIRESEIANLVNKSNPIEVHEKVESMVKLEKRVEEAEELVAEQEDKMKKYAQMAYVCILVALLFLSSTIWMFFSGRRTRAAVKSLEATLEDKRRVMSIVAHDFVNPFNSLIGFAELQLQYAMVHNDKELIDYSKVVYNSSQALYQVVGNVLAWSQLDGPMKANKVVLNVGTETEKVISICRLMAEDKGVRINVNLETDLQVLVDENHFSIVMRNVVLNAIKFTPKGGRISISSMKYGNKVSVVIDDTGVGIPVSRVEQFMNSGSLSSTIGTGQEKGMGLGLVICRDLVKANKGRMDIVSTEGRGTTVTLMFEMAKA